MKNRDKSKRVWIGPRENSGYAQGLVRGFRGWGWETEFIDIEGHPFRYEIEASGWLERITRRYSERVGGMKNPLIRWLSTVPSFFLKLADFIRALFRFRFFIFLDGKSLFHLNELFLLKFLGKKLLFIYLGSDSRPPYMDGTVYNKHRSISLKKLYRLTRRQKRRVLKAEKWADFVIDYPSFGHFHEKPFINGFCIGLPKEYPESEHREQKHLVPVILHCPSAPEAKGTEEIRKIIADLREEGYKFEYRELTGAPHKQVIKAITEADFIIDQLYSDTPLSAFPAEAAYFGKASVIGGYYFELSKSDIEAEKYPCSAYVNPKQIKAEIVKMLTDTPYREEMGRKAKDFVHGKWSAKAVTGRIIEVLEGKSPEKYRYFPDRIRYFQGACIESGLESRMIAAYVKRYGKSALLLDDKPELLKFLLSSLPSDFTD